MGELKNTLSETTREHSGGALQFLWRDLRLEKPWRYKAPFLLTLLYFQAAQGAFEPGRTVLALAASLSTIAGIAGLAYLSNDFADQAADSKAGKPNAVARLDALRITALCCALFVAALAPWAFVLPITTASATLLCFELILVAAYALPPLRLKARGVSGVLADALYAHAVPALLATLTYAAMSQAGSAPRWPFLGALAAWQFTLGIRNIVLHQIQDHDNDRRGNIRTWVVRVGPASAERSLRRLIVPLELCGFAAFVAAITPWISFTVPAFLLHWLWVSRERSQAPWKSAGLRGALYAYLDPFYLRWLPLLAVTAAVFRDPSFIVLVLIHILLSPDLRDLVTRVFAAMVRTQSA
jgi:1,4-dihydroxy-2-naphthoate octaprenyltransferase